MNHLLKNRRTWGTAIALSCLSPFQAAEATSVTLYGLVDVGMVYERKNGKGDLTQGSGNQSGSRLGFRGVEDLGNGYKAVFRLENGINVDDGTQAQGRLFGRWAYVGLSGGFGEVRLGRQWVYGFEWGGIGSPFGTGWSQGSIGSTLGYNDGDFGSGGRIDNAVLYTTPRIKGWQGGLGYSLQAVENPSSTATPNNDRVLTAGLRYNQGPLAMALTYERLQPRNTPNTKKRAGNLQLAASYDLDWIELHGTYGDLRNPNVGPSAGRGHVRSWIGGVTLPVSKSSSVLASYQRAARSDISGWALGHQYSLSKRTNLYAFINRLDERKSHTLQTSVGMRHMF
ncbi:MAG: Outer membrane porin protein [Paracidovorax wautersii]|uniref:Outer membrane porin protein n=1 Tax=Paracidovorax wautersii TaxID=1177982 RepID=A0A7V8FS01_9BURK|nr:MAG: Outer membrane porin protein [Paracidovorax wautersii]